MTSNVTSYASNAANGVHSNVKLVGEASYLEDDDVVVDGSIGGMVGGSIVTTQVGTTGRDFFTEDYYDYKDTFGVGTKSGVRGGDGVQRPAFGQMDEFNEDDEYEDDDDNNDFKTGPLAKKHDDEEDDDDVVGEEMDDDRLFEANRQSFFAENEEFDGGDDDVLMMGTFFKRVDSQELVKPKKAKIINNYLMGELLGDGSYGKVKECLDIRDLSRCAVKIINLKMVARKIPRGVEHVRKEISIMRRLNHKNIIKLYDTFEKGPASTLPQSYGSYNKPSALAGHQYEGGGEDDDEAAAIAAANRLNDNDPLAVTTAMMNANMADKPPKIYIFMDYCMTSLEKMMKTAPDQRLRNYQANYYFRQLIDGLEYLHSLNIIHNDIKPGNLLITCDNTLKICDFSISAELKVFHEYELMLNSNDNTADDYSSNQRYSKAGAGADNGDDDRDDDYRINPDLLTNANTNPNRFPILQCTPMFQCPEMLAENMDELMILKNAPKIDIWSSGITLYQLTTGALPFKGHTIHQIYENIRSNVIEIPKFVDKNLSKLILAMLDRDPIQRWSLKQIRDCEWFRKKHPIIQEELAPFPDDVVQNETSTFRMLQFLDKLCHENDPNFDPQVVETIRKNSSLINANLQQMQQNMSLGEANEPDRGGRTSDARHSSITQNAQSPNHEAGNVIRYDSKQNHLPVQQTTTSSAHTQQLQAAPLANGNGSALKHSIDSKPYNQATKFKKKHCLLM